MATDDTSSPRPTRPLVDAVRLVMSSCRLTAADGRAVSAALDALDAVDAGTTDGVDRASADAEAAAVAAVMDQRLLTASQRAAAAAVLLLPVLTAEARSRMRDGREPAGDKGAAADLAGRVFNVSSRYIRLARDAMQTVPSLAAALLAGTAPLTIAIRVAARAKGALPAKLPEPVAGPADPAAENATAADPAAISQQGPSPADRSTVADLAALMAQAKEAIAALGYTVAPRPDAAFAPAYVELPEPLRVEACPDCGLTFSVRLDWFLARAEERGVIYCPAGHLIELNRGVPAHVTVMTTRELLARIRTVEADNQRLRNTLDRVPRLASKPPTEKELEWRFNWLANHAGRTPYGQAACRFCGKQFASQTSGRRHFKAYHRDEVAALPVEHFDAP